MAILKPDVRIYDDPAALSNAAADLFVHAAGEAVAARGRALVALSGGSTPIQLFKLLAGPSMRSLLDWSRLHVFWCDERCVPPEDPESNYGQARDNLLSLVPIPPDNVHRVEGELSPEEAARAYARVLQDFSSPPLAWPRFDLVLLGMGEDGHTASLFPGSPVDLPGATAAVTAHYQGRPANRVTLTPPVLNAARCTAFLAAGQSKSDVIARVLKGVRQPELLPAQRIQPADGELIWMLDRLAAGKL